MIDMDQLCYAEVEKAAARIAGVAHREPTGCLGAAAALHRVLPLDGKRVGIVVSGGNVDLAAFAQFVA